MSDDYYSGPAPDRINEFTRARANEVRAEFTSIGESFAQLPPLDDLRFNRMAYAVASGTSNALTVTLDPAPLEYIDGMGITVKLTNTNSGPSTINVNGLGAKALRRPDGTALSPSDLIDGGIVSLRYEALSQTFRVMVGTVTINQEGIDLATGAASAYAATAATQAGLAGTYALSAAASVATYTPSDVLAKLLTVDGAGSGLDTDKVQGVTPAAFGLQLLASATPAAAKTAMALDLVSNTSDAGKPVSTAQQAAIDLKVSKAGDTMGGPLLLSGNPTTDLAAAPKQYVDAISTMLPLPNGSAVLATITNDTLSGLAARDGVTPVAGDRVLVPNQITQSQNGVYIAASGAWARASDADTWAKLTNRTILVMGGTQAGSWASTGNGTTGTLGTTPLLWQRLSSTQQSFTASNGVTKSGLDFQLSPMATLTLKGNATGGTAIPQDLTTVQVAAILPVFGTLKGLVPGVAPSTNSYLQANSTFVSALTPASVAATGTVTGSNLSGTNTGDQTIALTGDVTGTGTGLFTTVIANNAVSNAKMADMAQGSIKGRNTAGVGDPEDLSVATVKTMLGLSGTNTGDQTITLTGAVTGTGSGSFTTTLAANVVTMANLAQAPSGTFLGRTTAGVGNIELLTTVQAKALLGLSGTNTGDQINIAGNAATATALQTARTIAINGAVSGTSSGFDGSSNVTITVTTLDMNQANAGVLAVARGGTGTTASTGSGALVLSASPTLGGTTTMAAANISGNLSVGGQTFVQGLAAAGTIQAQTPNAGSTGGLRLMANAASGLAIEQILDPTGSSQWGYWEYTNGQATWHGDLTSTGNLSAYSDMRLKTDVKTITNALDKVGQMRGVTFARWSDLSRSSGVIAQELEHVAPELVATDGEGMKSVAYGNLVGYLIEAVKELTARVEALEAAAL